MDHGALATCAGVSFAIPLSELSATRERPIFSPLRRPPSPAVAAAPYVPPQSAKPVEPERPQLFLIGTIAGDKGGLGIFLDYSTDTILRLKAGEGYKGWILREVRSREIVPKRAIRRQLYRCRRLHLRVLASLAWNLNRRWSEQAGTNVKLRKARQKIGPWSNLDGNS